MNAKHFKNIGPETTKGAVLIGLKDEGSAGTYDFASMPLTGVVVDQETFELGGDVYEINPVLTDTGSEIDDAGGIDAVETVLIFDVNPTIPLLPGDVIRMESEFMIVIDANLTGVSANVLRGQFGSTAAAHTKANSDTFQAAQPVVATNLAVPVSAVAAATADGQIAAAVTFWNTGYSRGLGGGIGVKVKNGLKVDAFVGPGTTTVVFAYAADGGVASTLATDMTNATITAFAGGVEPASQVYTQILHKATAGDVSAGTVNFVSAWAVDEAFAFVADSTGVQLAWDGTVVVTANRYVAVNNGGATDWAAGDTIVLYITKA